MTIRIRQLGMDDAWQVQLDGEHLTAAVAVDLAQDTSTYPSYQEAVAAVASLPREVLTAAAGDGTLDVAWRSDEGIAFTEATGDGRDFTECVFTWRDPAESLLPLMLQTETEIGHFGAVLAGFIETLSGTGPVTASGRFYDTDAGRMFAGLLNGGRRFGVSVDAGQVDVEFVCTDYDDEGWCIDGVANFLAYEIIGLTGTPFPAFARASIIAVGEADEDVENDGEGEGAAAVAASAARPRPPRSWFETPEPQLGEPTDLGGLGDEWLVDQGNGALAVPLTITPEGRVFGHLAVAGTCHVGYVDQCVSPPTSACGYARFMVHSTTFEDGTTLATGRLTANCDHAASRLRAPEATDHYAHTGLSWADVRVVDGAFGPWVCGALRPDVTPEQAELYASGALSGDWRRIDGNLELIAVLAVSSPGFPVVREAALVAAAGVHLSTSPPLRARQVDGQLEALVASGIVRRCPDCARAANAAARTPHGSDPAVMATLARVADLVGRVERRTRHLISAEAAHQADRMMRGGSGGRV